MEAAAAQRARVEKVAQGAARVATLSMALSLASAQRCLALDSRVSGCESRILAVGESVGGVSERLEHIRLLVEAQSRAHRRLVGTVSALQSVVGSMDDRLRRVENASALRDALVDVACALAAWRVSGALAWTARRSLPTHAAGALVLGRRVVAVIELGVRAALVLGAVSSTRGALGALGLHSGTPLPEYARLAAMAAKGAARHVAALPLVGGRGTAPAIAAATPDPSSAAPARLRADEGPRAVVWATPARGARALGVQGATPDPEPSGGASQSARGAGLLAAPAPSGEAV
ncbi:hypothetical protein FNF29_02779 [Cafeteria roenbergensis]|uniref:Uncharacterized protein n=1 Tax=Cafeteria roenbergensis TaxID=33653 RepID=A0A5A8CN30_CAFRO|nr:hypothetical protein FNF29_02779 [Cafeteria roenbergensis]KAA0166891.1 hypothetical protein FNF31_01266 [Cafeteria roenbergensis]KAA0169441.1 hypothetical protein FNF28_02053 [Cafeteria roenbergensis]|eukprot:KAA0154159.1 hypothetical protein FNF29_02779 [Cafeteria roenbergensis]